MKNEEKNENNQVFKMNASSGWGDTPILPVIWVHRRRYR